MGSLQLRTPDDWHLHVRRGEILRAVLPHSARLFGRALIMPNTNPPILTAQDVEGYRSEISSTNTWPFEPLMTVKIVQDTTPSIVRAALEAGAIAGKLYPEGVTTGAAVGVRDTRKLWPTFAAMEEVGMVLCLHGELPKAEVLRREVEFLPTLIDIVKSFPGLRIVLEHLSTAEAVETVASLDNVAATITAHHLVLTLDDVLSDSGLRPHHFCKPVAKSKHDRHVLAEAATSGNPKFFFGSDSAPHPRELKESGRAPAGIFSAPVALPILAEVFERRKALNRLEDFTSTHGAAFYGLPLNRTSVRLVSIPWTVPDAYAQFIPFRGGARMEWQVEGIT